MYCFMFPPIWDGLLVVGGAQLLFHFGNSGIRVNMKYTDRFVSHLITFVQFSSLYYFVEGKGDQEKSN